MIIRSNYGALNGKEFKFQVVGEGIDDEFHEPCYLVIFLPEWVDVFQNGHDIHQLRKSLVGKDNLYEIEKQSYYHEQMRLF